MKLLIWQICVVVVVVVFFPHFRVGFHPTRPIGYYLNYDSGIFQLFYFSITIQIIGNLTIPSFSGKPSFLLQKYYIMNQRPGLASNLDVRYIYHIIRIVVLRKYALHEYSDKSSVLKHFKIYPPRNVVHCNPLNKNMIEYIDTLIQNSGF